METAAVVGLTLFVVSEILPFTPLKGNGIVEALVEALRIAFPYANKKR
jgi:hypothetical protein